MKQRRKILGLLGLLSALTFLDRLAIAVAGPAIQADLHIQPQNWGWILSAYVLANGIFEIPSGAMGDRRGQRGELTRIVIWWSCFNALTSWSRSFWQLCAARFLRAGRGGRISQHRGRDCAMVPGKGTGALPGYCVGCEPWPKCALAPVLIVPMVHFIGWRAAFRELALFGFSWATVWWFRFRNRPQDDPSVTAAELEEIGEGRAAHNEGGIPWRRLFGSRATLAHCSCLRLLWLRKLVLLFLVPHMDGSRSRVLAQRRVARIAAVSCRHGSKSCWRSIGRLGGAPLRRAASVALDPGGLSHADGDGADCDGALSWEDCSGFAVVRRLRDDGSDAAISMGALSRDWGAIERNRNRHDEYRRPGGRIFVHGSLRLYCARHRQLQLAAVVYCGDGVDQRGGIYSH